MHCEMNDSLCKEDQGQAGGVTSHRCGEVSGEEAGKLGRDSYCKPFCFPLFFICFC